MISSPGKPTWARFLYPLILVLGLLLAIGAMLKQAQPVKPLPELAVLEPLDRSPRAQRQRSEIVKAVAQQGFLTQLLKPDRVPEVYLGPLFQRTPERDRAVFLGMIFAFFLVEDSELDHLQLFDGSTKQPIGQYRREGIQLSGSEGAPGPRTP